MGAANDVTTGWFWTMMLFALSAIIFILARQKTTTDRAFAICGFGSWIFGTFMFYLGWISWLIYAGTIALLVGGIIAMSVRQNPEVG